MLQCRLYGRNFGLTYHLQLRLDRFSNASTAASRDRKEATDIEILPSAFNGIKKPSLIRLFKIATVDKTLALGKSGELRQMEVAILNKNLRKLLQL